MTITAIVDDYGPIARRMAEIAQDRLRARFVPPDGVVLLLRESLDDALPRNTVCLLLNERSGELDLLSLNVTRFSVHELCVYMKRFYPSITITVQHKLRLGSDDCQQLAARLRLLRR